MLRLEQTGVFINVSLVQDSKDTRVMLGPQEEDQMCVYTVTAINSFGMATSNQD